MKRELFKKPFQTICNFLLLIAPLVISESVCVLFWGEPEIPDSLK